MKILVIERRIQRSGGGRKKVGLLLRMPVLVTVVTQSTAAC